VGSGLKICIRKTGTGTKPKRTGSGTGTFKILRTGTETFILINKVPEPNHHF